MEAESTMNCTYSIQNTSTGTKQPLGRLKKQETWQREGIKHHKENVHM